MAGSETNTSSKDGANVPMDALWQNESDIDNDEPSLLVDVQGFEGPLDLLLHLARTQRVDLSRISVLALAEQYLGFVEQAQALKLELAADYLVMAAWLAYLKSKLLIPKQKGDDEATGEELIATLQFRLKRLEAMRDAAANLVNRKRLGRDVFARGMPELVVVDRSSQFSATLYELLTAYTSQRQRQSVTHVQIEKRAVWSLKEARSALVRLMGISEDWISLDRFLINYALTPQERASALASSFAASLELVREGKLEVRQNAPFEPIYMRAQAGMNELDEDADV
ncbi:ScpA family protein [Brucella pseudogrignonensis]|uniref:Segregation and condensation protein A n=1 Tax=Brucella pseudogrignonensis TaxID=419475 RepID=A0ABU1M542_9HYPH|nr:ScpA family protein [Brucella pseudogrignonensis]MDR6431149.1 segregation and condensation protein A [Brucella pseudogrignonensis]